MTHFHDPDPNAVDTVSVDWGDGTITPATVNGSEISAAHSYTGSDPYRPDLGRFSSSDPITITPGDLTNSNLYAYVAENPENYSDPTGHLGFAELSLSQILVFTIGAEVLLSVATLEAAHYITRFAPPAPRTVPAFTSPPAWATATGASPGISPGLPNNRNCMLFALNGPHGTWDTLPAPAKYAFEDGDLNLLRDEMDKWFFSPNNLVRGYPIDENAFSTTALTFTPN